MKPCNGCGKCCFKYGATQIPEAYDTDLENWRAFRPDLLNYIGSELAPDLWFHPVTGREFDERDRCPWLRKRPGRDQYRCRIYSVRPEPCAGYPVDVDQMIRDGCEMLEEGDLEKAPEALERELRLLKAEASGFLRLETSKPIPQGLVKAAHETIQTTAEVLAEVNGLLPYIVSVPGDDRPWPWEIARAIRYALGTAWHPLVVERGDRSWPLAIAETAAEHLGKPLPRHLKTRNGFLSWLERQQPVDSRVLVHLLVFEQPVQPEDTLLGEIGWQAQHRVVYVVRRRSIDRPSVSFRFKVPILAV